MLANLFRRGVKHSLNRLGVQEGVIVALGMEDDERVYLRMEAQQSFRQNRIYPFLECVSRISVGSTLSVVGNQMFWRRTNRRHLCL